MEGGKPIKDSLVEVERAIDGIAWAVSSLLQVTGKQVPMGLNNASEHCFSFTKREPKGVVFAVSAFNHPFNLLVHQAIPAIAVGCPVVLKPSLSTPLSAKLFVQLLTEAGIKKDWCQLLVCSDETTASLAKSKHIAFLSFIGSASVGWKLKANLYPGVSCNLEHGGTAPAIVNEDADLEQAVNSLVRSAFYHAGQVCVSTQNIFIHEKIKKTFTEKFLKVAKDLKLGDPLDSSTDVGPIIKMQAKERILSSIEAAIKSGAKPLPGSKMCWW